MSPLRNKTAEEIVSFIQGWLWAVDAHNDELNDQNTVFCVLRDILVYACPNGFGKTDDKQETAENVNHIPTNEELISSLIARPEELRVKSENVRTVNIKEDVETSEDYNMTYEESPTYCSNAASTSLGTIDERELCIIGNDIKKKTINVKEDVETSEDYNMTFEDAQAYCSKCGIDIPWNDGDIYIDERELTRTVGNVLKWADEHPKVELPKWKRMPLSDRSYVDDFARVTHIITSEKNGASTSLEVVQKCNYYIPLIDLEKLPKEK